MSKHAHKIKETASTLVSEDSASKRYFIIRDHGIKLFGKQGSRFYRVTKQGLKEVNLSENYINKLTEVTEEVMRGYEQYKQALAFGVKLIKNGLIDHEQITKEQTLTLENINVKGQLKESWISDTATATLAVAGTNEDYTSFELAA